MCAQIPVYDICNLINNDDKNIHCNVLDLQTFVSQSQQLVSTAHRHSFYQILVVFNGSGDHHIDFKIHEISEGSVFFLVPGQVHKWNFNDDAEGIVINFNKEFFTSFVGKSNYLEQFLFFIGNGEYSKIQFKENFSMIKSILVKIQKEYINTQQLSADLIRMYLIELFIHAQRQLKIEDNIQIHHSQQYIILRNFEMLVEEHFKTKKLPKDYAELLFITSNHLNAVCKKIKGFSAGEIIRNRIVLEIKRLLINSTLTIAEIAYELNFQDNSYFSRFFKKNTGLTPEEFRNTNE